MNHRFLILIPYFNRPRLVRNALQSIKDSDYPYWEIAFIDDGSDEKANKILWEYFPHDRRVTYTYINRSKEVKLKEGSNHGAYLNKAIRKSNADIVMILCDDDALVPDYMSKLNDWYNDNPSAMWGYSHVYIWNPMEQKLDYTQSKDETHFLNKYTDPILPAAKMDASQITWRKLCNTKGNCWFMPEWFGIDELFYRDMGMTYGHCRYTGLMGQYKAFHLKQLMHCKGSKSVFMESRE